MNSRKHSGNTAHHDALCGAVCVVSRWYLYLIPRRASVREATRSTVCGHQAQVVNTGNGCRARSPYSKEDSNPVLKNNRNRWKYFTRPMVMCVVVILYHRPACAVQWQFYFKTTRRTRLDLCILCSYFADFFAAFSSCSSFSSRSMSSYTAFLIPFGSFFFPRWPWQRTRERLINATLSLDMAL